MYKRLLFFCGILLLPFVGVFAQGHSSENINEIDTNTNIYNSAPTEKTELFVFVREGCSACKKEEQFLATHEHIIKGFSVNVLDIADAQNNQSFQKIVEKHHLSKVTPITLVGGDVLVGFDESTTGKKILAQMGNDKQYGLNYYLNGTTQSGGDTSAGICNVDSATTCSLDDQAGKTAEESSMMALPFFGEINVRDTSLFLMASILGFIDGFNPCAMWVLLTFLIILSQVGDKRKMIILAGIFILAESIMYFFILNVWYQTWDFIALDQWVTPGVGLLAIGAGSYFLYKAYKSKGKLTCDVTSFEHQQKTTQKIKEAVNRPITIITVISILGIAFSVNIIEFACSVGIAQSFTKIMEINDLTFMLRQWFVFVYTFFYMMDDFLIFGLAIAGYQRFHMVGAKYSHLSTIFGGVLMIILGILLTFFSDVLVF
jgi:cytochrome c biogenesis protein CcdA